MLLNTDFSAVAEIDTQHSEWIPSPVDGIERIYLDRIGDEVARATSLVRYAPNCRFPQHRHELGEEFLVLEGTFSDELGDYPSGSYVRNPPGSQHAPGTDQGCTIFVKLRQMPASESDRLVINSSQIPWQQSDNQALRIKPLFSAPWETVRLEEWSQTSTRIRKFPQGAEFFVLDGELDDQVGLHKSGSWMRLPAQSTHEFRVPERLVLWIKFGHLASTA